MKSTLKFLSASALLTLASSLVLTGCPEETTCTLDSDCGATEVCNADTNVCEEKSTPCTTNDECMGEGEACIANVNNDGTSVCGVPTSCDDVIDGQKDGYCEGQAAGNLCLPKADGTEGVECRAAADCGDLTGNADGINAFCRAAAGLSGEETFTCNTDGEMPECVQDITTEHYHIIINDLSVDDCDLADDPNGFDPGSDITFVELAGSDAMTIGWGRTVTYTPGTTQNDFQQSAVLDGLAPDLITDGEQEDIDNKCPVGDAAGRFSATSVLTLGCGGSVVVDFAESDQVTPPAIYDGQIVTVGEYAPVCNQNTGGSTTGSTDKYEVIVCPAVEEGAAAPSDVDCRMDGIKISTTEDAGLKTQTVTGVKAAPAASDS